MNIRVTIVLIVGSMIGLSVADDAVTEAIPSTTSGTTSNVKKCHLIDGDNKSGFDVLANCGTKDSKQHWTFGLKMSVTAESRNVEVRVVLEDAGSSNNWTDTCHQNLPTSKIINEVPTIEVKKVKTFHPVNGVFGLDQAAIFCEERSWKLASIETEEENNQVLSALRNHGADVFSYWIAGYEPVINEGYKWNYTDKPFSFTNWDQGEPNRLYDAYWKQVEHCVQIRAMSYDWKWIDVPCNMYGSVLCEETIESTVPPKSE